MGKVHCRIDQHAIDSAYGTRSKKGKLKLSNSFMWPTKDVTCKKCKKAFKPKKVK